MFIKKIPNVIMAQRILKPSLLVLIIAGSRFLPNASAVRWIFNFEGKQIKASELDIYKEMLNFGDKNPIPETDEGKYKLTEDWFFACYDFVKKNTEKMCTAETASAVKKDGKSRITIVLQNGTLDVEEAEKLLYGVGMSFNIEFINCNGTLKLNEGLKEHAKSILFRNCKFETAPDCFKNTKKLTFLGTTLTPENGRLGIVKPTEVAADKKSFFSKKICTLVDAISSEQGRSIVDPFNKNLGSFNMQDVDDKLTSLQKGCDSLNKELEEIKRNNKDGEQYKLKVTELEKEVKNKDLIIENLKAIIKNLKTEVKRLENNEESTRKELVKTILNKNKEQEASSTLCKQLQDAESKNDKCKGTIENMKAQYTQLKKENERLSKILRRTEGCVKGLETSKSELKAINETLKKENDALKEKIRKSSETVQSAEKAIEGYKKLKKANENLRGDKEKANDKIDELQKDIKTLKKHYKIAIKWANYNVSLIGKMKEREIISSIKAFLQEMEYWKKQREIQNKLEGNEDSKNLKTRKGRWSEFDPMSFINTEPSESKKEEEAKEEPKKESKDCFDNKTDNCEEDYSEKEDFQRQNGYSGGFELNELDSGNQGRGGYRWKNRGNYRGGFRETRGGMMAHKRRGTKK